MVEFVSGGVAKHHDVDQCSTIVYDVIEDDTYLGYIAVEFGIPDNMLHVHIDHPIDLSKRLQIFKHFKKHFKYPFTIDRSVRIIK